MNCKTLHHNFPSFEEVDLELGKTISHIDIEHITDNEDDYCKEKTVIIRNLKYDWII